MTNYEHIMQLLTPNKISHIMNFNAFINGAIPEAYTAFERWAERKCTGCHNGNVWENGAEKIPNPFICNKVFIEETGEWVNYGHGKTVSKLMFLEDEYNPTDWSDE